MAKKKQNEATGDHIRVRGESTKRQVSKRKKVETVEKPQKTALISSAHNSRFPIVGIGASAGGLEALEELLGTMPKDTGAAFVIVTHQFPGHTSLLPTLLSRITNIPVVVATDGAEVVPNHIYVDPPGGQLAILKGRLHRRKVEEGQSPKLPIDYFLRSLAADQHELAICVILSGTGSDGTLGLKAIKGESGMAMVEQPETAKFDGMPLSAINTGLVDYILPPAAMPRQLIAYIQGPYLKSQSVHPELTSVPDGPLQKVFVLLRHRTGNDFSTYKHNMLRRRIERRMNVHELKNAADYVHYLEEHPQEIDILFNELLISVTGFFRDPPAWEALAQRLEGFVRSCPDNYTLRVWVPGCATGEEAFSIAILLKECMDKIHRHLEVQIFGSDLDANAVESARSGKYPEGIAVDVSPERLERFFIRGEGTYRIRKEVRELVIFAQQNLIKDPPFTRLDMISCRNLLIYLEAGVQKKLLPIFHYSLKPDGLLFLGPSESIGTFTELFEPLDKRWKLFRRKQNTSVIRIFPELPDPSAGGATITDRGTSPAAPTKQGHLTTVIEQILLGRFAPPSVVVNERGDIVYIHGRTGAYLELSQGQPRNNLIEMAREGLKIELAAALRQCVSEGIEVSVDQVQVATEGQCLNIDLKVAPLCEPEMVRGLILVTFCPGSSSPAPVSEHRPRIRADRGSSGRIVKLERELQYMRQSHQTTLEELETSNEELKSTNEELQSTNEELQSTNEELETSKEELQSLNEELTTVNAELHSNVEDLSQANDDMQNLLNSTDIATVFLDNELNILRFTDQVKGLVMLRPVDIGRPISDLALNLEYDQLTSDCKTVLKSLIPREAEVRCKDGSYFLMRILPYRTAENAIDGLVLTFVNINRLKKAETEMRQAELSRTFFESIVQTISDPLVVLDEALRVVVVNDAFCSTFKMIRSESEGKLFYDLGDHQWDLPEFRESLETILPLRSAISNLLVEHDFPTIGHKRLCLNGRRLERGADLPAMILLSLQVVPKQ